MSLVRSHCFDSIYLLIQTVQAALSQKYQNTFAFYRVRTINQLLYGYRRKSYIDLCDARNYSEEAEYMRRLYYHQTSTGKEEITSRLKLCAEYYSNNPMISYEYPMMIVTNTKSLFVRRHKRLRKIMAGEGSEDSSGEREERLMFWEEEADLLGDLDRSSLMDGESYEVQYQFSYDQEYDAYGFEQSESDPSPSLNLKKVSESDVNHLIQDMTESQPLFQPKPSVGNLNIPKDQTLKNISNKFPRNEDNSISITPIETISLKSSNQFFRQPSSIDSSQREPVSYTRLSSKFDNPIVQSYKPTESTTFQSGKEEGERQQLDSRRRRIRQKAQQLLKRVRKQESECF